MAHPGFSLMRTKPLKWRVLYTEIPKLVFNNLLNPLTKLEVKLSGDRNIPCQVPAARPFTTFLGSVRLICDHHTI